MSGDRRRARLTLHSAIWWPLMLTRHAFLDSIDVTTVIGLRDRALIAQYLQVTSL